ncbi:MAG: DUF1385 domain-containing protein [Dehalococcoidia bacterium]|nr:DUF1385 domain-containing protein [Dehalococcoidia bacterium]HRC62950.1 DUF1385 domain-containing protein [Dehalococcoidia bacterium]
MSQTYGGQAVVEGVMIRGARAMAVAVRRPDGSIALRADRLGNIYTSALRRIPLIRGVIVLWETIALGMKALAWSASVATEEVDEHGEPQSLGLFSWLVMGVSMAVGVALFFVIPVVATAWLEGQLPSFFVVLIEGILRLAMLIGYIWLIGRSDEIGRVFQYHGAEHMAIHAYEEGRELTVQAIRRFPKEHPRCGTSFLLTVGVVAVFVFALLGSPPLWWRITSRIVLVPVIASVAYEAIRFAGFHQRWPLVRWLFAGNIALQYLTTRVPEDEHIQVAIASLEHAVAEDDRAARGIPPLAEPALAERRATD